MYRVLPPAFFRFRGIVFALTAIAGLSFGFASVIAPFFRWDYLPTGSSIFSTFLASVLLVAAHVTSQTGRQALWRKLWHKCPKLSDWLFPDLNGVWIGTVYSNYLGQDVQDYKCPVERHIPLDPKQFMRVPAVFEIRANFWNVKMVALFPNSGARTEQIDVLVNRDMDGDIELSYVYEQDKNPKHSPPFKAHLGAARLTLKGLGNGMVLHGLYWTAREWREKDNTAGYVAVQKFYEQIHQGKNLREMYTIFVESPCERP